MKLSHHVLKTSNVYYNTVTKIRLPLDSSEETLRKHHCIRGQEKEAIRSVLLNRPADQVMGIAIAPTFECNLRCTHCMVKHLLVEENQKIDIAGTKAFISKCKDRYNLTSLMITFYGGESLLAIQDCADIISEISTLVMVRFSLFSNLSMELTDQHMEFLAQADTIGVSIDGLEQEHNKQRLWLHESGNAFQAVIQNLKKLVLAGLKDKIQLQACLRDEFSTPEMQKEFYKFALRYGILPEKVTVGVIGPSKTDPEPGEKFLKGLNAPTFISGPCCKYRQNNLSIDNTGNIYSDYYSYVKLGTIYDDPALIEEQQEKLILETAPALNDPKCKICPIVGYCWGGCSMVENTGNKLSKYCDEKRKVVHENMLERAKSNTLIQEPQDDSTQPNLH